MSKVIWYLHPYAGAPDLGMAHRPYYLCQEFHKLGLKPWIITASYHHLLRSPRNVQSSYLHENINQVPYIWLKTNKYGANNLARLRNMLSYRWRLAAQAQSICRLSGQPQVIIVSSAHPFHFAVARRLAAKYNAKLIFEVRDLWPLSLVDVAGVNVWHPIVKILSAIEKKAYKQSDHVVSLLQHAENHMQQKGLSPGKFAYIPNGVALDVELSRAELPQAVKSALQRHSGKFLLGYVGALGRPNAMDQLFEALSLMENKDKIHVFLLGDGERREWLQQLATRDQLTNVTFFSPVSREACFAFLRTMDALFLGWQDKPLYDFGISPNKLFEYMLAKKPIIHACSAKFDPVKRAKAGLCVPADQPTLLAQGLEKMLQLSSEARAEMAENGYHYVKQYHCYTDLARQYVALFNSMDVMQ